MNPTKPIIEDTTEIIRGLVKIIIALHQSIADEENRSLMAGRLIRGIVIVTSELINFDKLDPENEIDEVILKIEKLMPYIKENKHDPRVKLLGESLAIIYDELITDKNRIRKLKNEPVLDF